MVGPGKTSHRLIAIFPGTDQQFLSRKPLENSLSYTNTGLTSIRVAFQVVVVVEITDLQGKGCHLRNL